jgi:hypothetical protein
MTSRPIRTSSWAGLVPPPPQRSNGSSKAPNPFDVLAGWVIHACRQRGWPALTIDPARLRRLDPTVPIDLL